MSGARLESTGAVSRFLLAGDARFTLVSKATGTRYTYRVRRAEPNGRGEPPYFVSVLTGADNESSYSYAGLLLAPPPNESGQLLFKATAKSKVAEDAPSVRGFKWFLRALFQGTGPEGFFAKAEFWHEGRCCRCGRALTVPESIASGIGPECARRGA